MEDEGEKPMTGNELLRLLNKVGMSRRALGRELGIADSTVCRWITGESPIGLVESLGLASYFENVHGVKSKWKAFK